MSRIDNLSEPNFKDILRRLHALETGAPMNNGAVGRSGFEVYEGGTINISSGNLIGAGTFSWTGSFTQSGTTTFSGATTIAGPTGITGQLTIQGATSVTGPLTVTGDTKLNGKTDIGGNTTITGTLDVTGVTKLGGDTSITGKLDVTGATKLGGATEITGTTTLKADLNVTTGKVKVGTMTLDPAIAGGALTFGNGSQVFTDAGSIQLFKGNGVFQVDGVATRMQWGGNSISVSAAGVRIPNAAITTQAANVYMDANGYIFRKNT